MKYRVQTDRDYADVDSFEEAKGVFETWKDAFMSDGVVANESFVELTSSNDGFETETTLEKVIAVVDEKQFKDLGEPRSLGFDWDYWAKWEKVGLHSEQGMY